MDQSVFNALRYDPNCSWVNVNSQVYFNGYFFLPTGSVKVVTFDTDNSIELKLAIYPETDYKNLDSIKSKQPLVEEPLKQIKKANCHSLALKIKDRLYPGSYVAQVYRQHRYKVDEPEALISEHSLTLLDFDTFSSSWRQMFGGEWDEPVYLDKIDTDSTEELLSTLPVDDILALLPSGTLLDGEALCHLLGPLTTAFMTNNLGPLPFLVEYKTSVDTETLPHIDLTKLFWLLNVLSFVLVDTLFFSSQIVISVYVGERNVSVYFTSREEQLSPAEWSSEESAPAGFISVIQDAIKGQLNYDLDIHPPYKTGLYVYAD